MRVITISKNPPRSVQTLGISLSKGYQMEKQFSQFFLFGGGFLILIMLFTAGSFPSWGIAFFAISSMVVVVSMAFKKIQSINHKISRRKIAYEQGHPVTFTVIKHRRKQVWYKSGRDYEIVCQCPQTGAYVSINNMFDRLWKACPVGSQIYGLCYQNNDGNDKHSNTYIFGEMLSVKFQFDENR